MRIIIKPAFKRDTDRVANLIRLNASGWSGFCLENSSTESFRKFDTMRLPMLLLFLGLNVIVCHAQQAISDDQAIKSLQHFYVFYVKHRHQIPENRKKIDSLLHRYSTPRLTEQLKRHSICN